MPGIPMLLRRTLRFTALPASLILFLLIALPGAAAAAATAASRQGKSVAALPAAHIYELPTEALLQWRRFASSKPALVIFSFDPMLHPYPAALQGKISTLVHSAGKQILWEHGSYYRADPWLLPPQTVGAALDAGLFSAIYWVYPPEPDKTLRDLNLQKFRKQLPRLADFSQPELAGFRLHDGIFAGRFHGHPFFAVHPSALPAIRGPVIVHIDLSYLADSYHNEVKTPIYKLLHRLAASLRAARWDTRAVTISLSQAEGIVSPDYRFLGRDLARLLDDPGLLEGPMPKIWSLRSQALYQATFMRFHQALKLYRQEAALAPNNAAVQFDLYRGYRATRQRRQMLGALDRAVALDPGYAAGYLDLAEIAAKTHEDTLALRLYRKAARLQPANTYIRISEAETLKNLHKNKAARAILEKLESLPWSKIYHPRLPAALMTMAAETRSRP